MTLATTILTVAALAAKAGAGKTSGSDSWHAFTLQSVSPTSPDGITYLQVAAGDIDGHGVADQAVIKLTCIASGPA